MAKQVDTENFIRETAVQLFGTKGFEGTGIRDLAREAGLTPSALYHYVNSKQDLLVRIMREGNSALTERAEDALARAGESPVDRLSYLVANHVECHCVNPLEAQVVDYEVRSLSAANRRSIVELRRRYEELWSDVLAQGMLAGDFDIEDVKVCRLSLIQMCTGVANWYSDEGPLDAEAIRDRMVRLALRMVGVTDSADRWSPEGALDRDLAGEMEPAE